MAGVRTSSRHTGGVRIPAVLFASAALFLTACGYSSQVTAASGERSDEAGDFRSQLEQVSAEEVSIDDDPEVEILKGETVIAMGSAGSSCTPG